MGIVLMYDIFLQPTVWVTIDNQDFENTFYHKYEAVLSSHMFTLTKKACKKNQFLFLLTLLWWHTMLGTRDISGITSGSTTVV